MPGTTTDGSRASRDAVAAVGSWPTAGTVIVAQADADVLGVLAATHA